MDAARALGGVGLGCGWSDFLPDEEVQCLGIVLFACIARGEARWQARIGAYVESGSAR